MKKDKDFIREIFTWAGDTVDYYLSSDIQGDYPGVQLNPGDVFRRDNSLCVHAFGSTDLGISALVEIGGLRVFHAGDLNWWHWREESTPREIEQSETAFKREMEPIIAEAKKAPFDIAFFPVDPRQRTFFDAGANYFILSVKPRVFVPMHTMGRGEVANDFARRTQQRGTKVVALVNRGQTYTYES